jgi:hypothetical protein
MNDAMKRACGKKFTMQTIKIRWEENMEEI